jgi:stage III sporulation protein AH
MVKRQTVWLSTMMVLSLMLIGYYTLGTPPAQNTATGNGSNGPSGTTVTTGAPTDGLTGNNSTGTTPSDWFASATLEQNNKLSQVITTLQSEVTDTRLTSTQVAAVWQKISALQQQKRLTSEVHDTLIGQGYRDSIVYFAPNGQSVRVIVEASKLDPMDAVKVINTVSSLIGIQANQVYVKAQA